MQYIIEQMNYTSNEILTQVCRKTASQMMLYNFDWHR